MWRCDTEKHKPFPAGMTADMVTPIVWAWVHSEEAKAIKLEGWDKDADHDGSNSLGWRVFVENWGHIDTSEGSTDHYAMCAITPAYMWYGK